MGMMVLFKGNFHSLNGNISSNPCSLLNRTHYNLQLDCDIFGKISFSLIMAAVNMLENGLCAVESNSERNVEVLQFKFKSLKLFPSDEHFDKVGNRNFSAEIYIPDDLKEKKLVALR